MATSFKSLSVSEYDNYIELSLDGVTYEIKLNTSTLITFSISYEGVVTEYQAEEGMTWNQFIESSYNTNGDVFHFTEYVGYKRKGVTVCNDSTLETLVGLEDVITATTYYAGAGN